MLRERLKSLELRITELADYLQVSRPTMYKYIECYDNAQFDQIDKRILKLFNYICENELVGKKNIVNYILTRLVNVKDMGDNDELSIIQRIKNYVISNPDSKKSRLIVAVVTTSNLDDIICYLSDILPLLKKKKLTYEEQKQLQPYYELKNKINKGDK